MPLSINDFKVYLLAKDFEQPKRLYSAPCRTLLPRPDRARLNDLAADGTGRSA